MGKKILEFFVLTSHYYNMGTVVIAGANGSGKTRLKEAIIQTFQGSAIMTMTIEATRDEENQKYFNGKTLEVLKGVGNDVLINYIQSRKYGAGRYVGSLVQIDSDRSVRPLNSKEIQVNWLAGDPDDSGSPPMFYFNRFTDRWSEFMKYIHQKSAARDKKLAELIKEAPEKTGEEILDKYPDPMDKYKQIFSNTLPGKNLLDIDPANPREFHYRDSSGQTLNFRSLGSGEQEIIKILFDVARKEIKHSIIIVDEPELHLHPTLTFQLIESLKNIGDHTNQFIFLTHSSDLISTYYATGDVYFIDSLSKEGNQAHKLSDLTSNHKNIASLIGQNLGLFAVGKKLVFVEGVESGVDRLAYQKIAQTVNSEIRVVPIGSVLNIMTLNDIEKQIRETIFGIDLYMIRDRDGLTENQVRKLEEHGRIRCLKRRHIENYFLDVDVLAEVVRQLYLESSLTKEVLEAKVKEIAEESLGYSIYKNIGEYLNLNHFLDAPAIRNLEGKDVAAIKKNLIESISENMGKLSESLASDKLESLIDEEESSLRKKLSNGEWIKDFQGKYIFAKLCGDVLKEDKIRIQQAYVDIVLRRNLKL